MVARTVVDRRYKTFNKWIKATVINDIWPELLFFTLVATSMASSSFFVSHSLMKWTCGGGVGNKENEHIAGNIESDVDGAGYRVGSRGFIQDFVGVRSVSLEEICTFY